MTLSISSLTSSAISSEISSYETMLAAPITKMETQITGEKAQISVWGSISGAISSLSDALAGIKDVSSIDSKSVNSSNKSVATLTADNSASSATYNLTNVKLAQGQEIYSSLQGSSNATLSGGKGALVFTMGSGKNETVSIGSGSLTLNDVAAAINKQGGGVKANVIGTSAGARLVMESGGTGASAAFTVTGTGALSQFAFNPSSSSVNAGETMAQTAQDASFTLNGVPIISATNTLSSTISGVTLTLAGSGTTSLSVSSSPSNFSTSVQSVATSLNKAISLIATATKYVPASSANGSASAGILLGNFSATELKNELVTSVSGLVASGVSAGAIGLSVSGSGAVSFNATSFANEYATNSTAVEKLVSTLYKSLNSISTSAIGGSAVGSSGGTKTTSGFISAQTTSLNAIITSLDTQVKQQTKASSAALKRMEAAYSVAESKASSASITESYLSIFNSSSSSKS
jgi:flagellar hook-associated protein 2